MNGAPTMEPRNLEDRIDMGQRRGLTRYDIKHVNVLYECPGQFVMSKIGN